MKECPVVFLGLGKCDERPDGECVVIDNDGVPDGKVSEMAKAFEVIETECLLRLALIAGPKGYFEKNCKVSNQIYCAALTELTRRMGA